MIMKTFVGAKIHNIRVTDKSVEYMGSVTIARELMAQAGIQPYEQVHIINLNNGQRWITYAVPGKRGEFRLNGGGARLGEVGDLCVVLSYYSAAQFWGAKVLYCDYFNCVRQTIFYEEEGVISAPLATEEAAEETRYTTAPLSSVSAPEAGEEGEQTNDACA